MLTCSRPLVSCPSATSSHVRGQTLRPSVFALSAQPVLCRDRDVCVDSVRHLLFSLLHLYRLCLDSFPPSIFRIRYPTRLPISIRVELADTYSFGDDRESMGLARDRVISFLAMGTLVRLPISYPRLFPSLKSLDQPTRYHPPLLPFHTRTDDGRNSAHASAYMPRGLE
jgi:hypothetical protein